MSDKFKIIDHATFERMQQSTSNATTAAPKIRNSKYKRMTATNSFNLLQFTKPKERGLSKKGRLRKPIVDTRIVMIKKKGKQREGGKAKKPSRLKRSILQYRQKKREQAQLEKQLTVSVNELMNLKLDGSEEISQNVSSGLHSCKFRKYCNCCTTPELKKHCEQLIRELNHFQRRAYAQNEIKARAHRRFVVGFREVQSYLRINKVKLVIIATDCEHNDGDVSLNETIENIKTVCNDQQIPVVFAFKRREMAYFLYKKASVSCIGVLDYDGAREIFSNLVEALKNAREMYNFLKEIGKMLNELWSYPILVLMAYGFLIFTAQLYFLYCATQGQDIPSLFLSAKNAFITAVFLFYTSGKCIYLIFLSWKTSLESKCTGICLHKCGVAADNNDVYEIINHLSLKLLNHTVDFTACGFFSLNMETLYGISGGITSYLIILIQFNLAAQQAKEAMNNNSSNRASDTNSQELLDTTMTLTSTITTTITTEM